MNLNGQAEFPRKLTALEIEQLNFLLPENIDVYNKYRIRIKSLYVIGQGRLGEGNYILGKIGDVPDLSYSSLPVFASGQIVYEDAKVQVTLHEEFDEQIEFSINIIAGDNVSEDSKVTGGWTYSTWKPGDKSPFTGDELRTVNIAEKKNEMLLVLSKVNHSIWLYEDAKQYNHIIPVTNFINELLRGNTSIDRTKGINMNYIFDNLNKFKDGDFVKALVQYNKQWHKVNLSKIELKPIKEKASLFSKIFRK
ncbi:MAG: hypothetical protein EHM58_06120 [Ignavibacteriae bacterium]|nr:MAG: hypothetical protein EHM58_06120 [Ignavibacteriota bacterium]